MKYSVQAFKAGAFWVPGPAVDSFFKYKQGRYLGVMESMIEADATWSRIRKEANIIASICDLVVFVRYPRGQLA